MLNSLSLATSGRLSGGIFPTLSMAVRGFLFAEMITLIAVSFADDNYTIEFKSKSHGFNFNEDLQGYDFNDDLHNAEFSESQSSTFNDSVIAVDILKDESLINYEHSMVVGYNDSIITASIDNANSALEILSDAVSVSYNEKR